MDWAFQFGSIYGLIDEIPCQKTVDLRFVLDACRGTLKYVVPKQDGSQEMWEVESSIGLNVCVIGGAIRAARDDVFSDPK